MREANLLKVLALRDPLLELGELRLEHIGLQIELQVVDEEGHVETGRGDLGLQAGLAHFLEADLQAEAPVELHLDAARLEQEGEDLVVLLEDFGADEGVEGPFHSVREADSAPTILSR